MDCLFCKIVAGKIPAKIVLQTDKSMAFLDAFPIAPGHCLVIPKTHYEKVQDMTTQDNAELFDTVHKLISKVDKLTNATLVAIHNGKKSGQEIPHVHVHLVPRTSDDSAGPIHSMFKPIPKMSEDDINQIIHKLQEP